MRVLYLVHIGHTAAIQIFGSFSILQDHKEPSIIIQKYCTEFNVDKYYF